MSVFNLLNQTWGFVERNSDAADLTNGLLRCHGSCHEGHRLDAHPAAAAAVVVVVVAARECRLGLIIQCTAGPYETILSSICCTSRSV